MNLPLGYRIRRHLRRDTAGGEGRSGADRQRTAGHCRRGVHAEPRAGGAGAAGAASSEGVARACAGAMVINAGNANCATRTGDAVALATCKAAAKLLKLPVTQVLPASTGVIGVELDARKIIRRAAAAGRGAERGSLRRCGARHHDHGPGAEDGVRRGAAAARRGAHRGHDQGLRHDPADDGDHAGLRDDRRDHSAVPQLRAMLKRGVERSYNRHLGGRRHFHQRHAAAAGQRRIGRAAGSQGAGDGGGGDHGGDGSAGAADRARWRRRAEVGHDRGDGRRGQRGRGADRARHRQFAAGEDGDRGLRPELGPHSVARPAMRAWRSIRRRRTSTCRAWRCAGAGWRRRSPSRN